MDQKFAPGRMDLPSTVMQKGCRDGYHRVGVFPVQDVLSRLTQNGETVRYLDKYDVDMSSSRYPVFEQSLCCYKCGVEGQFFALERNAKQADDPHVPKSERRWFGVGKNWHFNLYAIRDGKAVLMTRDHIIPKSLGGANALFNYRTMCTKCNGKKGNKLKFTQFFESPEVKTISRMLKDYNLWAVGGCVRDAAWELLTGVALDKTDTDFLTDCPVETVETLFDGFSGFTSYRLGDRHETVKVKFNGQEFDITSTTDLDANLRNRDLTINSMAVGRDGTIIDPMGGLADLTERRLRLNNGWQTIVDDPIRFMRFFRFMYTFGQFETLWDHLDALADKNNDDIKPLLEPVTDKRVWAEMAKAAKHPHAPDILAMYVDFFGYGVNRYDVERAREISSDPTFLFSYMVANDQHDVDRLGKRFGWPSMQRAYARSVIGVFKRGAALPRMKIDVAVHNEPKRWVVDGLKLQREFDTAEKLERWTPPSFPLTGDDASEDDLRILKLCWGESGFRLTREQLLTRASEL